MLTEPTVGGYENHQFYAPGQSVVLPDSIGAKVTLGAAEILEAGRPRTND